MKFVGTEDVRSWYQATGNLNDMVRSIGGRQVSQEFISDTLGLPLHLAAVVEHQVQEKQEAETSTAAFASIPFYSLCRALFIPLSGMTPEKTAQIFGIKTSPAPNTEEREALLRDFLDKDVGLSFVQKVGCLLGDPFEGKPSTFKRESLLRLLQSVTMKSRRQLLDRMTITGDVSVLFSESRKSHKGDPPLTAAEFLSTLRVLPELKRSFQFDVLRSLLNRCGKVEAYFLAKLILGKAGLRYESELLARLIGERFGVEPGQVSHAMALTDAFEVTRLLAEEGADGLRKVQLQPLVPVKPALASGSTEGLKKYPVWVERKYDGIRLMLHKTTDQLGSTLAGAYSRNRKDYLELVRSLEGTIKMIPAQSAIIDGELYGTVMTADGPRPATVYEVFGSLQGDASRPVALRYAGFDVVYLNGQDLTPLPLSERRKRLQMLLGPLEAMPLPIPMTVAEGQLAQTKDDVNRFYQHFRSQGYEGVITKDLQGSYKLAARDPDWLKRKPAITLDLVLLGAVLAVTTKEKAGMFGSYVIGARTPDGAFEDVGDVAGVDTVRDAEIQQLIMTEGLITGQRIERQSASGVRPGFELAPHIVVTIRFEGIIKDSTTGRLTLRDPKLVVIRADKSAYEADKTSAIEELYLKQKVG